MKRVVAGSLTTVVATVALAAAAPSAFAADACPNAAYRHGAAANLPDCRAWEQVSPAQKGGQNVLSVVSTISSDSGDKVQYFTTGALGNPDSVAYPSTYLSTRGSAWTTLGLEAPLDTAGGSFIVAQAALGTSGDRSKTLVVSRRKLTAEAVEGNTNLYVRDTTDGSYTFAATSPNRKLYTDLVGFNSVQSFRGASADFKHVAFASIVGLVPGAQNDGQRENLYDVSGGQIRLVSVDANGDSVPTQAIQPVAGQKFVSDDGKRITFIGNSLYGAAGLYQHVEGGPTVLISRSHRTDGSQVPTAGPQNDEGGTWPSADGTRVIFAAEGANLTADGASPFYRWEAAGDKLTDLLAGIPRPWSDQASSFRLRNVSPDERYLWFTLNEQGPNSQHPELWVLDATRRTLTRKARFPDGSFGLNGPVRFSPDGSQMAALSFDPLTGYDNTDPGGNCGSQPGTCAEAFAFDATDPAATPVCVSCGAAGSHSVGSAGLGVDTLGAPRSRVVTNSGRVVFDTPQALSPYDANTLSDAYEYVPGQGRFLLSSGVGTNPVTVGDASPSGDNVFFYTADSLVPQDFDLDIDVYDARVGGGFAAQQVAPAASDPCGGAACRAPQPASPAADSPGSSSFRAAPRAPAFSVGRVSAAARRTAVSTGRLKVTVTVGARGTVSARLKRRSSTIGRASRSASKAGRFSLTLALSRGARRALARGSELDVDLSVAYSRASKPATQAFTLARPARSTRGGSR